MAENSKIEWTHHTFNPWRGCTKVSQGCKNCYAEKLSGRSPAVLGQWGPDGTRVIASASMWREPLKWDRLAQQAGERHRVFCASLADVFEGRETMPDGWWDLVQSARQRLAGLIRLTSNLDWLLLTKRPENAARMLAEMFGPNRSTWPRNFRVGTSVENQETADERLPHLISLDWPNFVSAEPLLSEVDFTTGLLWYRDCLCVTAPGEYGRWDSETNVVECGRCESTGKSDEVGIDWVIVGGESGTGARPMHPDWARSIRDQCQAAGIPYLFKQWGEWIGGDQISASGALVGGITWHDWGNGQMSVKFDKKRAGRTLDGVIHDEFPEPAGVADA